MSLVRNRLLRRFSIFGRLSDLALVGGMALRVAQRKGWISAEQVNKLGLPVGPDENSMGVADMALAAFAALRLLRRRSGRRGR